MQALSRLLVRQSREARSAPLAVRLYGSLVPSGGQSPFLKASSPFPANLDHSPLLSSVPETQVTTLPNGMRVATETIPFSETATVGLYIAGGSRFETDATNGAANFLEHVLFKGTNKRSAQELELELAGMGGSLSAETGREQVSYSANVFGKDASKAVTLLSDVLLNASLSDDAIASAKKDILAKMKAGSRPSSELLFDHLHATAFQYSPLGRTVAGTAANISTFSKEMLVDYMKATFRGPRIVLAASGNVNHEELVKTATAAFAAVADEDPSTSVSTLIKADPARFTGSYVHDRFPDATLCNMAVAFKAAPASDADSVPFMVMQYMLGSLRKGSDTGVHASSPLTQIVASEHLAHSYNGFNTSYTDTGLFGFTGITTKEQCEDFAYYGMNSMTQMCYDVSDNEVALAKNKLKATIMFEIECTRSSAASIGRDLLVYGRRIPKAELLARIDAVDGASIRGVADKYIYDQDMAVASVGDVQFMPDMTWFRKKSYWLRY